MSTELRQLRGRVAVQERLTMSLSASIEEMADQLQEITATMATKEDIKTTREDIKQLSTSVDDRFKHVYGTLADIQANVVEVRNILATLVEKLEQK